MAEKLQEIVASLQAGKMLLLTTDRKGVEYGITVRSLSVSAEGRWKMEENCMEPAGHLGLGMCSCGSPEPSQSREIPYTEVLAEIEALIERELNVMLT